MPDLATPPETLRTAVEEALTSAGFRHRIVPGSLIAEMKRSLEQLRTRGIVPETFFDTEYAWDDLATAVPEGLDEACSLIIVAAPSPPLLVTFDLGDRQVEAMIPPTYVSTPVRRQTLDILRGILGPEGFSVEEAAVPKKMLAVRVGMAEYGRNGVAYIEGMGSFFRLDVYATDADVAGAGSAGAAPPTQGGTARGDVAQRLTPERLPVPPRMRRCLGCAWCYHACPTGCIAESGDRIDPLRCLTFLNENEGDWPAWLDPSAHNSLIGCYVCQSDCRGNWGYIPDPVHVESFDRDETEIILRDLPPEEVPEPLRTKLERLDLLQYAKVLGRNLRALVKAVDRRGGAALPPPRSH